MKSKFQKLFERNRMIRRMKNALWLRYDGYGKYAVEEIIEITEMLIKD